MELGVNSPYDEEGTGTDAGGFTIGTQDVTGALTVGTDQEPEIDIQELYPSFEAASADAFVQGAVGTQQNKSDKKGLAALVGALVLFAAVAGGGLIYAQKLKTKLKCEPVHLRQYAKEATESVDEFVRLWASSSSAVRNMFCANYFPRAHGVEIVRDPVPALRKVLDECKSVALPQEEGERKERALHLKYLNAVASAARGRLAGLQALEAFVKNAPSGIFPQVDESVDLVQYREFKNLLWNLRKLEGQVATPFPRDHLNELEVATSFRLLRDAFNRQTFAIFDGFVQLLNKTRAFEISRGEEEGEDASISTFKMLPNPYMFPTQMFMDLLAQFKELNVRRGVPSKRSKEFKVPESAGAAFNLLRDADGGDTEGNFRATRYKDTFVARWKAQARTPAGEFDLIQLGAFLL
ncbi:hypothetical protein ACSSS7_004430 [Eimeria intestinalis]